MSLREKEKILLSAYLDGEVSPQDLKQVRKLLGESKDARAYLEELRKLKRVLQTDKEQDLSPEAKALSAAALQEALTKKEATVIKKTDVKRALGAGGLAVLLLVAVVAFNRYVKRAVIGKLSETAQEVDVKMNSLKSSKFASSPAGVYYAARRTPKIGAVRRVVSLQARELVIKGGLDKRGFDYDGSFDLGVGDLDNGLWRYNSNFNTEEYAQIVPNEFLSAKDNPLSTFSIDVDTASYSLVRRFIEREQLPPAGAVRIEELINYFSYEYPQPKGDRSFSVTIKGGDCPWKKGHKLIMIGLKGKVPPKEDLPESNLVFLIDVSGSMDTPKKLPLLKKALKKMVMQLSEKERVAIVVYAGSAGLVLDSTPGSQKSKILLAIDNLSAGGSTNGAGGIRLAYQVAEENFIKGGNNRIILATDGDFNVGVTNQSELVRLIEKERKKGIFLTVLGFGMGNYKDATMEKLADKGNGNYYYIDSMKEAYKVLVKELGSTLYTIAKDVKIQVEFNPAKVKAYRLIGYENRLLSKEDFNDDTKDAGELGAGHTVTALYEIIPADSEEEIRKADDLKYQKIELVKSNELMTVKLRYKRPDEDTSELIVRAVTEEMLDKAPDKDFKFAAAVAEFGMILRRDPYKEDSSYEQVIKLAEEGAKGSKYEQERREFIELVKKAKEIDVDQVEGIGFKD